MTSAEQRAYQRGYYCGSNNRWPDHKPPLPSNVVIAEMMVALKEIRDICDSFRATLDEDEPFGIELEVAISKSDAALASVSRWLGRSEGSKS